MIFCRFSKIWKFGNQWDVIKSKLGQKRAKVVYYIYSKCDKKKMLVIRFLTNFLKLLWPNPNPSLWRQSLTSLSQIFQRSFRAKYCNQTTTVSSKLGIMCFYWGVKYNLLSFFQDLEIWKSLRCHEIQIGPKKSKSCILYSKCDKKKMLVIRFLTNFLKLLWPNPNPSFWRHSRIGSKSPKFVYEELLVRKGQNR